MRWSNSRECANDLIFYFLRRESQKVVMPQYPSKGSHAPISNDFEKKYSTASPSFKAVSGVEKFRMLSHYGRKTFIASFLDGASGWELLSVRYVGPGPVHSLRRQKQSLLLAVKTPSVYSSL